MSGKRVGDLNERQRFWLDHLCKCRHSGADRRGYARENGLDYSTLERMRHRLRGFGLLDRADTAPPGESLFHRVGVVSSPSLQCGPVRLVFANGVQVVIGGGLDDKGLREILVMAARLP
jgi:hypothetical protein